MIISILKSNKTFFIFLALLFGIFYWLSFTYPIVYDDVSFYFNIFQKYSFKNLNIREIYNTGTNYYNMDGRVGRLFIPLFKYTPFLYSFLVSFFLILFYGFLPYIVSSTKKNFSFSFWCICFATLSTLSLFFPWFFYIPNDFFNKTISVTYCLNIVAHTINISILWRYFMLKKDLPNSNILLCTLFIWGFITNLNNELFILYQIGMILGILILYSIRYKKRPIFSKNSLALILGIIAGSICTLTSKGILNQVFYGDITLRGARSNNLYLIVREIFSISAVLFSFIIVIYAILWRKSQLILSKDSEDENEFIYRSLYLFLVWCGFVFILYVSKIPYFRTMIIGATILPLVYLFLLGLSKLLDSITMPRYFIMLPISVVMYSTYVTIHNTNLMKNIINDFQKQIIIAQETNTDLIVPVYKAPFKHVYFTLLGRYFVPSEGHHANQGTAEEKQKEGMRIFFHTLSLNASFTLGWKLGFYQYSGKISSNQTITNKY